MATRGPPGEELKKLFVGGLNRSVTEEGFEEYFSQWGQMSDTVIIKDSNGQSKGFGFITFETIEQTDACVAAKKGKGHKLGGRDIEVKRAIPREMSADPEQTQKNTRMFIGGLGQDLNEEQIKSYFEDTFNCVVEVVDLIKEKKDSVPQGQTPRLRGFGFITFDDCDIVDKLCIMKSHEIAGKTVTVKKAAPRGAGPQGPSNEDRGYGGPRNNGYSGGNNGYNGGNNGYSGGNNGYNGGNNGYNSWDNGYNGGNNGYNGGNSGYNGGNNGYNGGNSGYNGGNNGYNGENNRGYNRGNPGGYGGNQGGYSGGNQGSYGGNQGGNNGGGYGGNQGSGGYGENLSGGFGGNQAGGYGRQNNGGGPQRSRGGGRGGYRPY